MRNRQDLVRIKSRALRNRVWYSILSKVERAIFNLTIRCVTRIRSQTLQSAVASITFKITEALENRFLFKAENIGRKLAENLSNIGQKWGNKTASKWKIDRNFSRYLGMCCLN